MSHEGKLSRGLKWWKNNRDLDGVLLPMIAGESSKMLDVNYYLDYTKDKSKEDVDLVLHQLFLLRQAPGGVVSSLFKDLSKQLTEGDFKAVKETKSKSEK